jgi:hypothetical protein
MARRPAAQLTNTAAVAVTVAALRRAGRIEDVDVAVVTAVERLAEAVDAEPSNASLWREFRAALADLRGVGADDSDRDEISEIIEALRGGSEMGDAPPA